jgi:hypothetical protein
LPRGFLSRVFLNLLAWLVLVLSSAALFAQSAAPFSAQIRTDVARRNAFLGFSTELGYSYQ